MQVLLINQNATIERLVKLSSGKLGYTMESAKDISEINNGDYDFIIIDSELYNEDEFALLKQKFEKAMYILIIAKNAEKPDGFNTYMEKPFLPTELVEIFTAYAQQDEPHTEEHDVFAPPSAEEEALGDDIFTDELPSLEDMDTNSESAQEDNALAIPEDENIKPFEADSTLDDLDLSSTQEDEGLELITDTDTSTQTDNAPEIAEENIIEDSSDNFNFETPLATEELSLDDGIEAQSSSHEENDLLLEDMMDEAPEKEDESLLPQTFEDMNIDELLEEEPAQEIDNQQTENSVFDEDEVNKLKDLLDETNADESEAEDFSNEDIKIHNDELGSLTEESLAEALGVSIEPQTTAVDENDDIAHDNEDIEAPIETQTQEKQTTAIQTPHNAIELNPNQSITISLDALKELLEMANVTINITLSKK